MPMCHAGVMHENPLDTHTWMIGIDSWVIQDGSHPDFGTGQRAEFALEFASRSGLRRLDGSHQVGARWVAGSDYEVTAQVVHDEPNAQVLDFGVLAYHFVGIEDPEHRPEVGAWVTGVINVAVDPSFYVDELAKEDGFPALIYTWTVDEVLQRTPDEPTGLVKVDRTDAWADDESPGYVLRCRLEPGAPKSR